MKRAALLLLLTPASAAGQSSVSVGAFLGSSRAVEDSPAMVGLSVEPRWGVLGVRASGGVDRASSPVAPWFGGDRSNVSTAWSGDLDLTLAPARWAPLARVFGGLDPTVFAGVGVHGARADDGSASTLPGWSWGAGLRYPLFSWLFLETDARWRTPFAAAAELPAGVGSGLEIRGGLTVEIGWRRAGARTRAAPAPERRGRTGRGPSSGTGTGLADARAVAAATLDTADEYLGVPYVWGGDTPNEGFDCSGYVRWVYGMNGIDLPRVSRDQARSGDPLPLDLSELLPGDLMAFAGDGRRIDHIAIYAGGGRILHSSKSGEGVRYDDLGSRRGRWYVQHWVAARRVIGGGGPLADTRGLRRVPLDRLGEPLFAGEEEPVDRAPPPERRPPGGS